MQVGSKRWHVDLQSRQEAQLLLSAVTLPGDVQRRRTAEDELSMREVFQEGDLISVRPDSLLLIAHHAAPNDGLISDGADGGPADALPRAILFVRLTAG